MAYGEIPTTTIGIKSDLTFSATTAYGHASAGKDLVLSLNNSGNAVLGANNAGIAGVFIQLSKNKKASALIGEVLIMRQATVGGVSEGHKVVCAGAGLIKNAGSDDDGAGMAIEIIENTIGGRVLVRFP